MLARRVRVGIVDRRPRRQRDFTGQKRVAGLLHPLAQPTSEMLPHPLQPRVRNQVMRLVGIEDNIVKLFRMDRSIGQTAIEQMRFRLAVVDVGQNRPPTIAPTADVGVAISPDRSLWFVRRVPRDLSEDFFVDGVHLPARERRQGRAGGLLRPDDAREFAERRHQVDLRDQGIAHLATLEPARSAYDQEHTNAFIGEGALHRRKRQPVIGRADDERVVAKAGPVDQVKDSTISIVESTRAFDVPGHVVPRDLPIWNRRRGSDILSRVARNFRKSRCVSNAPTSRKNGSSGRFAR